MVQFKRFNKISEALDFINENKYKLIHVAYPTELSESGDLYEYSFKIIYDDMNISLENWLRDKLDEVERKGAYAVAMETVRAWIDLYNELKEKKDEVK